MTKNERHIYNYRRTITDELQMRNRLRKVSRKNYRDTIKRYFYKLEIMGPAAGTELHETHKLIH